MVQSGKRRRPLKVGSGLATVEALTRTEFGRRPLKVGSGLSS